MGFVAPNITRSERPVILERLEDLVLKGFSDESALRSRTPSTSSSHSRDETPTTGTASLPTPNGGCDTTFASLMPGANAYTREDGWLTGLDDHSEDTIQPPPAPYLKDLDSFTEGTGEGSFDFLPTAETDQHGDPILTADEDSVKLLAPTDILDQIEQWREGVSAAGGERMKRQRSPTPDNDRRTRPRSLSMSSAINRNIPRRFPRRCPSLPPTIEECEPPD
ncbi:hypothetical protein BDQ12DRAFT_689729 [Crucibulum laeve]|uniref:Uncharacterized protein n=1 Tax=Crucibulum laeve TaxID=68775 RepID=A0A5C3LNX7_9AGAR|nr:hypothetical protein BDQ12DRAFT_689729 [Crucibulum laeve]